MFAKINTLNNSGLFLNKTFPLQKNNTFKINFCSDNDYLLAFDLDGTFAKGEKVDFDKFNTLRSKHNCKLAYVTGNDKNSYNKLVKKLQSEKNVKLPNPNYLVTSNGQVIYTNNEGRSSIDNEWDQRQKSTNFNRNTIKNTLNEIVGFVIPTVEIKPKLKFLNRKGNEPIYQIDYNPSKYNVEYLITKELCDDIGSKALKKLKNKGIEISLIKDYIPRSKIEKKPSEWIKNLKSVINPEEGGVYTLNILAANKANPIEYLREKNNIRNDHVITAGNSNNDKSLAESNFIFILVGNALDKFKQTVDNLIKAGRDNIRIAKKDGTAGVVEELDKILCTSA